MENKEERCILIEPKERDRQQSAALYQQYEEKRKRGKRKRGKR